MDAATLIREKADINKLLTHYNFITSSEDDVYIRGACFMHGGNNPSSFVVNKENTYWYCHTGNCGGGDIFSLVQKNENISFTEAIVWLSKFYDLDISNLEIVEQSTKSKKEIQEWAKAMRARIKKEAKPFHVNNTVEVAKYKDFRKSTIEHFNMTYCDKVELTSKAGKPFTLEKRLCFPIVQNSIQIGASFRSTSKAQNPKWLHAPTTLETKNILYNYDAAIGQDFIVLVEGITDVWAYHELGIVALATFGAHITDEQYKQIMRLSCDIVLSYDGDEAGKLITDKAKQLFKNKCSMWVVHMEEHDDPASIERNELHERFQNRRYCVS